MKQYKRKGGKDVKPEKEDKKKKNRLTSREHDHLRKEFKTICKEFLKLIRELSQMIDSEVNTQIKCAWSPSFSCHRDHVSQSLTGDADVV